ncbi:hypothetical protein CEQ90_20490, partial [Lewinellaceae bacterium SD302]
FYETASIGDYVFLDENADGIQDPVNDEGIEGVVVSLTDENGDPVEDADGNIVASTTTDADGLYEFDNLIPGDYIVVFETPTGLVSSPANEGGDDTIDSDNVGGQTGVINLTSGEDDDTNDAGFYAPASIGDQVFLDEDADGIQDPLEEGIPNVVVSLTDENGDPVLDADGNPVASTTTDADGLYEFDNLVPGDYIVVFETPTGFDPSPANEGGDDTVDSDNVGGQTGIINLISGEDDDTNDAGFYEPASIGDYVFLDDNGDGIQDPVDDEGIEGVVVSLTDENGDPVLDADGNPVASTTTDADGLYEFDNLVPGDYIVVFETPTGLTPSPANEGGDDTVDSDNVGGQTGVINLESGEDDDTNDAGFYETASLGDFVFLDENANGIQDGEPGIQGVTVNLLVDGVQEATTTTNGAGFYQFNDLIP